MKLYVYTTVLGFFALCSQVYATGLPLNNQDQYQSQSLGVTSLNYSSTDVLANSGASATAANGGQTVNFNYPANTRARIENVPDVYSATVFPTAPCMGSSSVGGSGVGFGFSVGTSWEARECMIGEAARGFEQAGYKADAMAVRCQSALAAVAPSCKALAAPAPK